MQLLFFDTFSHDSTALSDLNLDLVQFPSPVYVREVRVIPLGARVSANFPGGVRLGATNPAKVDLEFFVNNLRAPGASTFESIGLLQFNHNGSISMLASKTIATDGLVLRGRYSAITLAVYGEVSDSSHDQLARQGAAAAQNNKHVLDVRIKEEPVRPPESPIPDGNGRTIGESYAAVWTAKHSEVALKAEPPEEWPTQEGDWKDAKEVKLEPDKGRGKESEEEEAELENNNVKVKQEAGKVNHFAAGPMDWSRSKDRLRYRSGSRERSPGFPYPARSREASLDRDRYRSRSRDSRDRRRSRDGSRDVQRSREGSHDSYHRRSYENSVKETYRGRSRDLSGDRFRGSVERDKYSSTRPLSPARVHSRPHSPARVHSRPHSPARVHSRPHSPARVHSRPHSPALGLIRPHSRGHSRPPLSPGRLRGRSRSPRSYTRDTRTPGYDRSPAYRRDGSLELRTKDGRGYHRDRSPRTREYSRSPRDRSRSPRDYDRNSLHSSGSRRHFSPRRSHSPRNHRSLSPRRRSLSRRSKRSASPRYTDARSRTRSPLERRSRSPVADHLWNKRGYSPRRYSRSPPPVNRPVSRNGHPPDPFISQNGPTVVKSSLEPDVLDNVSDISEGDIPDVPEPEPEAEEPMEEDSGQPPALRNYIIREDIEEISDEEAEWSDDFEPISFSDFELDLPGGEAENPVRVYDYTEVGLHGLRYLCAPSDPPRPEARLKEGLQGNLASLVKRLEVEKDEDFDDRWIEGLEQLTAVVRDELLDSQSAGLAAAVIRIAFAGLNYGIALKQARPTNKVRHIKSGVNYVLELLDSGFGGLISDMLDSGLISILWGLFTQDHMAMPSKLLILRALDRTLDYRKGMQMFVESDGSLYQDLLDILGRDEKTRTKYALTSLVNKVHLYQLLDELTGLCARTTSPEEDKCPPADLVSRLEAGVRELGRVYSSLESISHPARHLPCSKHFQHKPEIFNGPERGYFSVMRAGDVINLLTVVLSWPAAAREAENLRRRVEELLDLWTDALPGLLFLCGHPEDLSGLVSSLLQGSTELCGINIVHRIHALQYIDTLRYECEGVEDRKGMETSPVLQAVQGLYGMTLTARGREAVVHVVTRGDNLSTVLQLTNHSSMDGDKDMKKSGVRGYANEIVLICVRYSENLEFLAMYSKVLYELGKHDEHSKLCELVSWTRPAADPVNLTPAGIPVLLDTLKKSMESVNPVNQENITCLRILANLAVPFYNKVVFTEKRVDLKYSYSTLLLYSADCLDPLMSVLEKVWEDHTQPSQHTATLVGSKGSLILAVLKPALVLVQRILESVISVRGSEYRDLSPLGPLVRIYSLLAVVPQSSPYYIQAGTCCRGIVSTLLSFTQPTIQPHKEDLSKSLWTEMMREVLKQVTRSPCFYIPGLQLLSQLLPLPLPIPSARPLNEAEQAEVMTARSLWSAHLLPLEAELTRLVEELGGFVYPPLLRIFQRTAEQVCGLAPPLASAVLTAVMRSAQTAVLNKNLVVSTRLMAQFAWLVSLPHIKSVFNASMAEEGLRTELSRTLELLFTQGSDTCQENAICALQVLCDPGVSLRALSPEVVREDWLGYLADSLPCATALLELITVLLNPFTAELRTNFSIQMLSMRTLIMFTQTDFTFSILKMCLNTKNRTLFSFLRKLSVDFSPLNPDCLPCVEATLEFLRLLLETVPEGTYPARTARQRVEEGTYPARNIRFSPQELSWVVLYSLPQDSDSEAADRRRTHPLTVLHARVQEHSDHQGIRTTQDELSELLDVLNRAGGGVDGLNIEEEVCVPPPTPLLSQWSWRPITLPPEQAGRSGVDLRTKSVNWRTRNNLQLTGEPPRTSPPPEGQRSRQPSLQNSQATSDTVQSEEQLAASTNEDQQPAKAANQLSTDSENQLFSHGHNEDHPGTPANDVEDELGMATIGRQEDNQLMEDTLESDDQLTEDYWMQVPPYSIDEGLESERVEVDLLEVSAKYLVDLDLVQETNQVCKEASLNLDRKKKVKRSALETKALHNKSIISTFKSGGTINLRTQRFSRGGGNFSRPDMFRARPPNTSRPPSLHVDDFIQLELKGQQPTGPTGYNKQSIKAAKELFAQREAAAALKPPAQLREATREPVLPHVYRGRGRGQDRGGAGGGRGYRTSNGQRSSGGGSGGFRREPRGWSPEGFRTSEPRDLGREALPGPREDRRFRGGRGERRGWERGRGRDKFGGGRGKDRDERVRHGRNFTR